MLLIVTEDGGLLLHHRDDKPGIPNPDCWAGFGGAVEDGETVEDAVLREVHEETGLQIADPIFLTEAVDHEGDGRAVSLFYVIGGVGPEHIDLHEGAGVGVHRIEDLPDLKMTPFVRRAIYSHLLPLIAERLPLGVPALRVLADILIIRQAPPERRGRVVAALMTLIAPGMPAGIVGCGLLLEHLPAQTAMLTLASAMAAVTGYGLSRPELRHARRPAGQR